MLAVARLLLLGKRLAQRGLLLRLFVVLLIAFAVALVLLLGKRLLSSASCNALSSSCCSDA
ncbi:hypothetical protein AK51_08145 [Serratia nematodiphila DZ0503SBS1]|nr:hypothetical protein AK51_08145 [Serratia nematodiphila DZ0503SBS1]